MVGWEGVFSLLYFFFLVVLSMLVPEASHVDANPTSLHKL